MVDVVVEIVTRNVAVCGCKPIIEPIEFEIPDSNNINTISADVKFPEEESDLCELKSKVICDYINVIQNLECGRFSDLEILLEEISYIEITEYDRTVLQK